MKFIPKSEKEMQDAGLFPKGEYDFEVASATAAVSRKSGSEMIKLKLKVYNEQGRMQFVDDYLLPSMEFKLRHFCEAVGLMPQYESGALSAEDCEGRSGRVRLKVEPAGAFPAKNAVQDYFFERNLARGGGAPVAITSSAAYGAASADMEADEDIPF